MGDWGGGVFTAMRKTDSEREAAAKPRGSAQCSVRAQRAGWGSGREVQEGGGIWMHTANSLHCTAETNTTL